MIIKNKKELLFIITFTISLIFAFINIKFLWNFLMKIYQIFSPFILGLIIAFVINVLMMIIENRWLKNIFKNSKKENKRGLSLFISLTLIVGFLVFVLFLIIPQLSNTIDIFKENVPVYKDNINDFIEDLGINYRLKDGFFSEIVENINIYVENNKSNIINTTIGIASNVVSAIVNLTISLVFAIYLLLNKETLLRQFNKVMSAFLPKKDILRIKKIGELSNKIFAKFVSGQCLEAVIIGVLCFIGMIILRLPYASTIAVLVGFTALIPVFGAFIGTLIGAFLIFMLNPLKAIIFVIFIIVLQQIEGNLIYPKVVGASIGLPSIWVLVAVFVGSSISGIIGMLISVPLCSILYSILSQTVNERLKTKK
ncbi:MAG: AI-2E family transporter [Firmicutes bacterium]|nr:AI-2E family transporter [Bacillota bacterium]